MLREDINFKKNRFALDPLMMNGDKKYRNCNYIFYFI